MEIRVYSPSADRVVVVTDSGETPLVRAGDDWIGSVDDGASYGLRAFGPAAKRFDDGRELVDPSAIEVVFPDGHSRAAALPGAPENVGRTARAMATRWPAARSQRWTTRPLVVAEVHVRGATMRRRRADAGTFRALVDEIPRLAALGVSVIELLPVQQFDPGEDNYWGYMPLVFGAVHRQYADGSDPARELADLVSAAHEHDVEVWLDLVFNHTTEEDEHGPTYNLRGLADGDYYALHDDGTYVDDAGTGNILDATSPAAQRLVLMSLDRFADLGVDGIRFDLASVLARDPDFVRSVGDWGAARGVRVVAEAWDVARYLVGRDWPDRRWMQWNDRFRDDVRGFLRGEPGLVGAVRQRLQGSPDLFDAPTTSINFLTAHDGFTMYDLVAYDRKHNEANGWGGADGPDENRSWNCGWEGDDGVPDDVMLLRRRQLRNAWTLLLLSHGTPMFVGGDEFARTQLGNNNPYRLDDETSWIDWDRREAWLPLEEFVGGLTALRAAHPVLTQGDWWGDRVEWFGVDGGPDLGAYSRSLAWHLPGLYVMANMWWEPLDFALQVPGRWWAVLDTTFEDGAPPSPDVDRVVTVGPRSVVVLTDTPPDA